MQNVEHCDNKKLESKVSSSASVPTTSKATTAKYNPSGNGKNNMSAAEVTSNNKFTNSSPSPAKSDMELHSETQPRFLDSSESDEESVSEADWKLEIPDSSCSDCEHEEVDDEEEDDDCEDEEEEDDDEEENDEEDEEDSGEITDDESVDSNLNQQDPALRLEALLEAAANENVPVLRNATLALDEAAQALNRMRNETSSRERNLLSRSLIAACADNDVSTVRRLLGDGNNTINEGTDDGESLLSLACSAGYYELAQVLLAMSAQVEDRGQKNDCTPLMEAASAGHVDIIKLLINHNADVNAQSSTGNTPLMYACAGGHVRAVKELLSAGANVEDHNENGHTPLMEAASAGHVEVAKILLEHGAGINTHSNEFKESALTLACYKGHLDMVRFLLEAGADQEHKTDEMHTALMEASMDGHVEVARLLLDSGAQVNMPTDSFESPLTLAACGGHVDLAMLLLERGANIEEVNDEGYTPLMEASREGHEEMAALLLSQGANINAQTEETQETALTLACCGGFLEVADYLLKNGADLELGASTPLMEAAQEGHLDLVRFLLESAANVHAQTQTGDTALTYACENGHTDVADVLLCYGAELEHESEGGRTPLMKACRAGHICTIKFLISKGADVNRQSTSNDHTPLSLACAGGHQAVVEVLLKSGADPFHKLKDNSTMLIEASKSGHIGVVQLLLDYPDSMGKSAGLKMTNNGELQHVQKQALVASQSNLNQQHLQLQVEAEQLQQQLQAQHQPPIPQHSLPSSQSLPQQMQQPLQQLTNVTSTNLGQPQAHSPPGLQEVPEAVRVSNQQFFQHQLPVAGDEILPNTINNMLMDPNTKNSTELQESILANMRFLRNQGFKDGLALGLARFGLVNNATTQNNTQTTAMPALTTTSSNVIHTGSGKLKSLRKSRQAPAPFELNPTEGLQTRLQPFGSEDEATKAVAFDKSKNSTSGRMGPSIAELFSMKDSNEPALPTSYIDLALTLCKPKQTLTATTPVTNVIGPTGSTTLTSTSAPVSYTTTSTPIAAPSEVLPNTAISDRPKVKSVSKKDSKNIRKAAAIPTLQNNQMAPIKTPIMPISSTEQNLLQQSFSSFTISPLQTQSQQLAQQQPQQTPASVSQQIETHSTQNLVVNPLFNRHINKQLNLQHALGATVANATETTGRTSNEATQYATSECNEQMAPNETILQLVAQIPNHPLQKIAQRLITDQSKAGDGKSSKTSSNSPDIADISRIFCEVIRSELNANTMHEFVVNQKASAPINLDQQPQFDSKCYVGENDHLSMFSVEENVEDNMEECSIYPDIDSSLENFQNRDNSQDSSREPICNLEWADDIDVINVLHGVSEWPVTLQEVSPNCSDYVDYANYIGINSACKMRWTGQWPQHANAEFTQDAITPGEDQLDTQRPMPNQLMAIDHQLHQQLQQQFCVEQFQLLNQLQSQQPGTISVIPNADVQNQTKIGIPTQPNQLQLPIPTSITSATAIVDQTQLDLTPEQAKIVFNVDPDKTSPSLQLLFQLPNVQGNQAQQSQLSPPPAVATSKPATITSAQGVATQLNTNPSMLTGANAIPSHHTLAQSHAAPLCSQHSQQVQVATQTPQQVPALKVLPTSTTNQPSPFLEGTSASGVQPPSALKSMAKKSADKARKERKTIMRQAPAGSQANTTQQPVASTPTAPEKTIDVDSETDSNHDTALTLACAGGHEELVELLINRGANIEHRDKKGFTPLILAATAGHEKVVNALLKHGAEIEAQSERTKDTPLSLACSGGRYEVVEILLNVGANKEHRNVSDYTPLSLAASGGYVNIIRLLLNQGAEINSRTGSKLGISPLMLAAMNGHTAAVKMLLDMGSDINAQIETNRNTALTLACFQGRHEVVSLLLDRKANVEHRAKTGLTPLMEAASGGYIEVGRVLLDKGADVNAAPVPSSRDTALTIAADKGHLKFVDLLLQRGAAVEVKNKKGNSPLWLAANGGHIPVVKILKNHDANIDSQDNRRVSCLMAAFRKGHTKVVEWMVNHVTQFPSDQEMTRYISTVSDKELSEKCRECVKIIRAAKEAQAVKANKNASILLEELDMERNREESRKAAAARRRERKKKKKLEKKEEKRKQMQGDDLDDKDDSDKDDDSDKEDSVQNVPIAHQEKEEGDSGIDANSQGSCSSADVKAASTSDKGKNSKKNKNKKVIESTQARTTEPSPPPPINPETSKKKEEVNNNRVKSKEPSRVTAPSTPPTKPAPDSKPEIKPEPTVLHQRSQKKEKEMKQTPAKSEVKKESINTTASSNITINTAANVRGKEKENILPKEELIKPTNKKIEPVIKAATIPESAPLGSSTRKTLTFGSSRSTTVDRDDFFTENDTTYFNSSRNKVNKSNQHHEDNSKSTPKLAANHNIKREEGWKEVIRKSSTQQQTVVIETACKKVQVPTHAISRVIGRAGSNINAIRAATGAHIEVEKQGKNQSDRSITIKGAIEATKQAHVLITALIKDPDVDILQMLPKVNNNARSVPPSNVWDKSMGFTSQSTSAVVTSSSVFSTAAKSKPITSTTTSTTLVTSSSKILTPSSSSIRIPGTGKSVFTPSSQSRTASTATSNRIDSSAKKALSLITSSSSANTKTSYSDSNAIAALKNSIKNSSANSSPGTFASKLSTDSKTTADIASAGAHLSPKHGNTSGHSVPPFANAVQSSDLVGVNKTSKAVSGFGPIDNIAVITAMATSTAPNRTINASPVVGPIEQGAGEPNVAPIGPPSSSGQYQQKLSGVQMLSLDNARSHEYSLFDCAFGNRNQWNRKPMYNPNNNQNYLEEEPMPKADASKAPGYRGAMNSPVNTKPAVSPKIQKQQQQQQQQSFWLDASQQLTETNDGVQVLSKKESYYAEGESCLTEGDSCRSAGGKYFSAETDFQKQQQQQQQQQLPARDNFIPCREELPAAKMQMSPGGQQQPPGQVPGQIKPGIDQYQVASSRSSASSARSSTATVAMTSTASSTAPNISKQNHPSPFNTMADGMQTAGVIKPIQAPPSSGLAVQRPSSQMRLMNNQMENFNMDNKDQRSSYYDQSYRNMNFNQVDSMQNQFQQGNVQATNPLHQSRLNPRASVFSSVQSGMGPHQNKPSNQQPNMSQNYGGNGNLYQQNSNQASNANMNPYQKMSYANQNAPPNYNPAPGRPQSQPQAGSNGRWFSEFSHLNHASPNEIMNMENGALIMAMNSPAMSPNRDGTAGGTENSRRNVAAGDILLPSGDRHFPVNASNVGVGGGAGAGAVGNKGVMHNLQDDSRKMPRPIGTERASWKYGGTTGVNVGGNLDNADAIGQQQMPPWLLEKNQLQSQPLSQQQQQPISQPWLQYPMARNHFVDELHIQDPYQQQIPIDYYNSMPPQNQQPPMMQSMHYPQMVPPEIGQQPDLWDHDKHGWSKWTN